MALRQEECILALLLALCLLLAGCGSPEPAATSVPLQQSTPSPAPAKAFVPYEAPPIGGVAFHPELAEGIDGALIDLSAAEEGYVAVSVSAETRIKVQVLKDEWVYTYDVASDGTPSFLPLQCGDGLYTFRIMENVAESRYAQLFSTDREVKLLDEFQPFLRSNDYACYSESSASVSKAAELASVCSNRLEVVSAVYSFVCENIRYDYEKAAAVQTGYLPDVDETLRSGKGICFDYAALAAAMLRSQGIPTKVIFGYVAPDNLYHAWNMFYTEESGWVTVSFEVSAESWNRIDLTFSAGGADDAFIGNGTNYIDVYIY